MTTLKDFLGPARVPFLLLPPACVALGAAAAKHDGFAIDYLGLLLALIGAIAAHVSVNALNEYHDSHSGLDSRTSRTPFSGGSGTLQRRPDLSRWAGALGIGSASLTALIGIYFIAVRGWGILPLGIAGLMTILAYTTWVVRHPLVCLLAPGAGFGTFMVMGTSYALTGTYSWTAAVASLVPFFLVNNLLLLNQFPDIEADRSVGRRSLPVVAGLRSSAMVYLLFMLLTYVSIAAGVATGALPPLALLGMLTLALSIPAVIGAFRNGSSPSRLVAQMGMNVGVNLLTPLLVASGLVWG